MVLQIVQRALRGSVRHSEVFLRFIRPHLGQLLNQGRYGRILAETIEGIRKGRQQPNVDAHTFPQALAQRIRRTLGDGPEPPRKNIWDELNKHTREPMCLNDDPMHSSWRG